MGYFTTSEREYVEIIDFSYNYFKSRRQVLDDLHLKHWPNLKKMLLYGCPLMCEPFDAEGIIVLDDCNGKIIYDYILRWIMQPTV